MNFFFLLNLIVFNLFYYLRIIRWQLTLKFFLIIYIFLLLFNLLKSSKSKIILLFILYLLN